VTKAAGLARSLMDLDGAVLTFDGTAPRQLMAVAGAVLIALNGTPLLMAGVGRDEQIKGMCRKSCRYVRVFTVFKVCTADHQNLRILPCTCHL
jgi:hypothetical protein